MSVLPDLLSPKPEISGEYQHLLESLQFGGAISKIVKVLRIVEVSTNENDSRMWTEHEGLSASQLDFLQQKRICINDSGCRRIEQATRGQEKSPLWRQMRQMRLTASNFGRVFKRIKSRHPKSLLEGLLVTNQLTPPL